ncbi:DUF3515 domain-containing protein [Nocardioides solisilvae]|uniref:DUF3515 domain-containing protein n=1 Tax=Nocardioides solisilvae TaxID=1542435 RepID=UPI0013A5B933|nr:DUF3515 domain-containing protein [Nocardioides solisilvae]
MLAALLLAGCGGAVEVAAPQLPGDDRERCESLVAELPAELFGQERREVEPDAGTTAAWGDPPVVLVCGADEPEEYDEFAACTPVGGAGWFMPDTQLRETGGPIEITAMSHTPRLQVRVPAERRASGADSAMAALGPLVVEHLDETLPCH